MKQSFKFRVYPTRDQERWLFAELKHQKRLYNYMLQMRSQMYQYGSLSVSRYDQQAHLTKLRENSHYGKHPQDMQVETLKRLDVAYEHFFRRCKNPQEKKKGAPRFKRSVRSVAWCLRKSKGKRQQPVRETGTRLDRLKVPKLGEAKIYMHRQLQGDPKEVTLVKKVSGWYAHISCELPDTPKVEPTAAIAVDVGTADYLTTSEGEKVDNPRWYRQAEGLLQKHAKDLSRKKLGSNRRKKQQHKLALHHERTANKRKDFIGKLVYKLYHHQKYNVLVAEDLSISNMVQNKHLSKSISDASWAKFFEWAGNIAERDGFHFHQVDPKNTSQRCSSCAEKASKKLSLAIRTFNCQFCGTSLDRDHNAAINILFRAAAALRGERWVATLCEARNKNKAQDLDLQNATQLMLFDALTSPSL